MLNWRDTVSNNPRVEPSVSLPFTSLWTPSLYATALCLAQLLSPQICCRLFLNSCYSGATVCAWNIKHSPSNWLSLTPSLTVGDCSHHWLTSIRRTVTHFSQVPAKEPSRFSSWLSCVPTFLQTQAHNHFSVISP